MSNWKSIPCSKCPRITLLPLKKNVYKYCGINGTVINNPKEIQKWCPLDDTEEIMTMSEQIFNRKGYTS